MKKKNRRSLGLYFMDGDAFIINSKDINYLNCDAKAKNMNDHSIRRCSLSIKDGARYDFYDDDMKFLKLKDIDLSELPTSINMSDTQFNHAKIDFHFTKLIKQGHEYIFDFYADDKQIDNFKTVFPEYALNLE